MGKVAIVGCGAAGAFCAANLSSMRPDLDITVFEAGKKPLAKADAATSPILSRTFLPSGMFTPAETG